MTACKHHPIYFTIAGANSGFVARLVAQPLDVLKIRFQLQQGGGKGLKYSGIISAVKLIVKEEGVCALWKGHVPAQLLSILYGIVQFNTYEHSKRYIEKYFGNYPGHDRFKSATDFICGGVAGSLSSFICQPLDVIRTRLVVQEKLRVYRGIMHAAKMMFKENGIRTYFKGIVPTLAMIFPYSGLYFSFYQFYKRIWREVVLCERDKSLSKTALVSCGTSSGACSKLILLPFDMVKKRLQVAGFHSYDDQYKGMVDCFCKLVRKEGISVLFRGASPTVFKAGVTAGVGFCVYEKTLEQLHRYEFLQGSY